MSKMIETPDFKSESEEAAWWDSHEDDILAAFEEAEKDGTLQQGTLAREFAQAVPDADKKDANQIAERKSAA